MARFKIAKRRVELKPKSYSVRSNVSKYIQLPKSQLRETSTGKIVLNGADGQVKLECYVFTLNDWLFDIIESDLKYLGIDYKFLNR